MRCFAFLTLPLLFVGCAEVFRAHPQVVARVGDQQLSVRRLAELMVLGQPLPLTAEVGEELARHWIDVSAFAHRLAEGDSLWDEEFVREAMWLNLQQLAISRFRDDVARSALSVSAAAVDSAFRVGEHRIVAHVLKSVPNGASLDQRRAQRAAAEAIREQLRAGGSWAEANLLSDDSIARGANGNLGVLRRGVAVPRFENAAYELEPGTVSPIVETPFGFHIIFRPELEDVRGQFAGFVTRELRARFDSAYDAQLITDMDVQVSPQTPNKLRRMAADPFNPQGPNDALVTFEGGKLTSARFAEYLKLLVPETRREMTSSNAQQLSQFAVGVAIQEMIVRKVDSAGMQVSDSVVRAMTESYHEQLVAFWSQLGLVPDSVLSGGAPPPENASRLVDAYFDAAVSRQAPITPIPPFLAARLLGGVEWEIYDDALAASVQMAQRLQSSATDTVPVQNP